nr:reverse transcriptase domain-containing protein [Tanacetum cinerariifolium]
MFGEGDVTTDVFSDFVICAVRLTCLVWFLGVTATRPVSYTFGLRNTEATYQRLVDKAFHKQIGRNLEVYVDDLIIKKEGMFLGYKVSTKGLKVYPDKKSDFHWTTEAEEAFTKMKRLIAELPMLTAPMEKEELIVYLEATKETPRVSVKGQILADFIVERPEEDSPDTLMEVEEKLLEPWILFMEGSPRTDGSGARLILTNPKGMEFTYALRFRNPQQQLTSITSLWPFYKRGIDIARLFPEGPGKVKFLIVAIDYFTKWIEPKPVATINGNQVKNFMWDNIVCRFRLSGEIISDNRKQFRDNPFKDWCEKLCIHQHFASVKRPQTNGLVKTANRSLGKGTKARLNAGSKNWMEELSHVLWAHRTMIKSSNRDTPFSLTYGMEAVIPAEIGMPILRTVEVDLVQNNKALEIKLDLLEEQREQATIREAKSKAKMEKYYNSKARNTSFKLGDLVYHNNDASRVEYIGKLGPKWEGTYKVTEALRKGRIQVKRS